MAFVTNGAAMSEKGRNVNNIWLLQPINEWLPTRWYGGSMPGLPDLCVGKLPAVFGRVGAEAWKVWFVETPSENVALREALSKPTPLQGDTVDFKSGPDAVFDTSDMKHYGDPVVALYPPNEKDQGWPWISVFRLSSAMDAGPIPNGFGRGVYAYEIHNNEASAMAHITRMHTSVSSDGCITQIIYPGTIRSA
jgi:hypothetical protein